MEEKRAKEIEKEKFNRFGDGVICRGCIFSKGSTPFDDAPDKSSCSVYQYPKTKPDSVFLDGGVCKYRRE